MKSFLFTGCIEIKELLGKKADNEAKLMELIEEVPVDSIYYHMHSYFLHHSYIVEPFPHDFANWVAIQVRDKVLGEKLSAITPWRNKNLEDIRNELIEIIDQHLSDIRIVPGVIYGHPFYFMKSRIIEVPTGLSASSLGEFRDILKVVEASAIYNHIFEARFRVKKGKSDFAFWLDDEIKAHDLAEKIDMIDAYMYSLEGLRAKLISLCNKALGE